MTNLFKQGSDWLQSQRKTYLTEDIVYTRGATSLNITATLGRSEFERSESNGFAVQDEMIDFLISVADLGELSLPEVGDVITANSRTYEVNRIPGEGHFRYSDSYNTTFRIHTKMTGAE
jgi:hypothetical protein